MPTLSNLLMQTESRRKGGTIVVAGVLTLWAAGCAIQAPDDPNQRFRIEQSLRSEQDWAYWNEWQRHSDCSLIRIAPFSSDDDKKNRKRLDGLPYDPYK